jgi:hypothetical protein
MLVQQMIVVAHLATLSWLQCCPVAASQLYSFMNSMLQSHGPHLQMVFCTAQLGSVGWPGVKQRVVIFWGNQYYSLRLGLHIDLRPRVSGPCIVPHASANCGYQIKQLSLLKVSIWKPCSTGFISSRGLKVYCSASSNSSYSCWVSDKAHVHWAR